MKPILLILAIALATGCHAPKAVHLGKGERFIAPSNGRFIPDKHPQWQLEWVADGWAIIVWSGHSWDCEFTSESIAECAAWLAKNGYFP